MYPIVFAALLAALPEFNVQPLQGDRISGRLVSFDAGQVAIETNSGRVTIGIDKVSTISPAERPRAPAAQPSVWVDLIDGSSILAADYAVKGAKAKITLTGGEAVEIPTREVAAVRLQSGSPAVVAEWARILGMKLKNDVLVSAKGESIDYHEGTIQEVNDKQVQFTLDGEVLGVKRAKVFGVVYYHATEPESTEAPYTIVDATGSRWSARTLKLVDDRLQWESPAGQLMQRELNQVAQIDLSRGKIVYLSDLRADSSVYTPFFGLDKELPSRQEMFAPRQDKSFDSKPLQVGSRTFSKGLALHSRTETSYTLPGKFSRFEAICGIDDSVRPRGHVHLILRGDDKTLFDSSIAGNDLPKAKEPPKPMSLDIAGVHRLVIVVDFGEDLDVSDHLDLADARLIK